VRFGVFLLAADRTNPTVNGIPNPYLTGSTVVQLFSGLSPLAWNILDHSVRSGNHKHLLELGISCECRVGRRSCRGWKRRFRRYVDPYLPASNHGSPFRGCACDTRHRRAGTSVPAANGKNSIERFRVATPATGQFAPQWGILRGTRRCCTRGLTQIPSVGWSKARVAARNTRSCHARCQSSVWTRSATLFGEAMGVTSRSAAVPAHAFLSQQFAYDYKSRNGLSSLTPILAFKF
jgi:hypothetical protein